MIQSMTGFARAVSPQKKGSWSVEIRSLNHRYFEFSLKVPPSLYGLEDRIREMCQNRIRRGKVTVSVIEMDTFSFEEVALDEKVLRFYLSAIRKIQRRFRLEGPLAIGDLLSLPRIFSVEKKTEVPEKIWRLLKLPLEKALGRLIDARVREGKVLSQDLLSRVGLIENALGEIEQRTKSLPREYYEKIRRRVRELFDEDVAQQEKVWQAAALIAEKADVTEEIVRLRSHIQLFRSKIGKKTEGEVGKELDFLLQEMNREANTISSKAQDFGVSKEVIFVKAELEKIREQIQNIE